MSVELTKRLMAVHNGKLPQELLIDLARLRFLEHKIQTLKIQLAASKRRLAKSKAEEAANQAAVDEIETVLQKLAECKV